MQKYSGMLKTAAQAKAWSKKLREDGGQEHKAAARMLDSNWHAIAARPAVAARMLALVNTTSLGRKGGIMDVLTGGKNRRPRLPRAGALGLDVPDDPQWQGLADGEW